MKELKAQFVLPFLKIKKGNPRAIKYIFYTMCSVRNIPSADVKAPSLATLRKSKGVHIRRLNKN